MMHLPYVTDEAIGGGTIIDMVTEDLLSFKSDSVEITEVVERVDWSFCMRISSGLKNSHQPIRRFQSRPSGGGVAHIV